MAVVREGFCKSGIPHYFCDIHKLHGCEYCPRYDTVLVCKCDRCGEETDEPVLRGGQELCEDCAKVVWEWASRY